MNENDPSGNDTLSPSETMVSIFAEFGLTRQESSVYSALHSEGSMNGYEISKLTGISRSNAYTALASLVDKGAAWMIDGTPTRYTAVPAGEFCDNRLHRLGDARERLLAMLPSRREETGGYITIRGREAILDRLRHLILETTERLYLALHAGLLAQYAEELVSIAASGKKLVIITDCGADDTGPLSRVVDYAQWHVGAVVPGQIRAIADSRYVLTGGISAGDGSSCLFSDQRDLVELFKSAFKNEIRLAEIDSAANARADAVEGGKGVTSL